MVTVHLFITPLYTSRFPLGDSVSHLGSYGLSFEYCQHDQTGISTASNFCKPVQIKYVKSVFLHRVWEFLKATDAVWMCLSKRTRYSCLMYSVEGSTPLLPKPTVQHDPEPVPSTFRCYPAISFSVLQVVVVQEVFYQRYVCIPCPPFQSRIDFTVQTILGDLHNLRSSSLCNIRNFSITLHPIFPNVFSWALYCKTSVIILLRRTKRLRSMLQVLRFSRRQKFMSLSSGLWCRVMMYLSHFRQKLYILDESYASCFK